MGRGNGQNELKKGKPLEAHGGYELNGVFTTFMRYLNIFLKKTSQTDITGS